MIHVTKAGLYKQIALLRNNIGLEPNEYGINVIDLCRHNNIKVDEYPFITTGLRGMAQIGNNGHFDGIILNSNRNSVEQNIDCAHEYMHLVFHRNGPSKNFSCFEKVVPGQNKYLEWQANEGGAELLVPYQSLLYEIKTNGHWLKTYADIYLFKEELVHKYNVTEAVITYRLESLRYEIEQYSNGISMQDLHILSLSSQQRKGMNIKSLNDIAIDDLSREFETKHCNICQNTVIDRKGDFCPICGNKSFKWGSGKMKYPVKIIVNEKSKAFRCPICDNEDIASEGTYCSICGAELVNRCTDIDEWGNGCGALATGNARYCIYCGSKTTFYHNGILKAWEEELKEQAICLPVAQLEDLNLIRQEWGKIIKELGGVIRSSFRDTIVEPSGDSCLCVVFGSVDNYEIGRRPTALGELERYVETVYGKAIYFKARLKGGGERTDTVYIDDDTLKKAIYMNIAINE